MGLNWVSVCTVLDTPPPKPIESSQKEIKKPWKPIIEKETKKTPKKDKAPQAKEGTPFRQFPNRNQMATFQLYIDTYELNPFRKRNL